MENLKVYVGLNKGFNTKKRINKAQIEELKQDLIRFFSDVSGEKTGVNFSIVDYTETKYKEKTLIAEFVFNKVNKDKLKTNSILQEIKKKYQQEAIFLTIEPIKTILV